MRLYHLTELGELPRDLGSASRWLCCVPPRVGILDRVRDELPEPALSAKSEPLECSLEGGGVPGLATPGSAVSVAAAVCGCRPAVESSALRPSPPNAVLGIREPASLRRAEETGGVFGTLKTPSLTGVVGRLCCA